MSEVKYNEDGKVHRVFTEEWANNSVINYDNIPNVITLLVEGKDLTKFIINTEMLPQLVKSLVAQRKAMIGYIHRLHNEIDSLKAVSTSDKIKSNCEINSNK